MTKLPDFGLALASRRSILRGSLVAAGAAALGAGVTQVQARAPHGPMPMPRRVPEQLIQAEAEVISKAPPVDLSGYTRVKQELVAPPFAPAHEQVATGGPKIIEITLETTEKLLTVDADTGAEIWALTYNGSVPGPLIIAHVGDYVEVTLRNPVDSVFEAAINWQCASQACAAIGSRVFNTAFSFE